MSKNRKIAVLSLSAAMLLSSMSNVFADSSRVVTLGANLSEIQKEQMLKYFGVNKDEVVIMEVNNQQEREYLEGVLPDSQIGTKTYSCSYVEPTSSDKINVKTVNLTYITSSTISSAIATATGGSLGESGKSMGVNVVVASPIKASGTGGLTGVLLALEDATGETLDEDKKELANEEMIITGDIGQDIGQDKATGIVNDIKIEVIKNGTSDTVQIAETINNITNNYNVTLSAEQTKQLEELMQKISEQDYNYKDMKNTLNNIAKDIDKKLDAIGENVKKDVLETVKDWFSGIGEFVSGIFSKDEDLGILETTNDALLGENAQIDATNENAIQLPSSEEVQGFFAKIWNAITDFFKGLFNKVEETVETMDKEEVLFEDNSGVDINTETETESQVDTTKQENVEEGSVETNNTITQDNVVNEIEITEESAVLEETQVEENN